MNDKKRILKEELVHLINQMEDQEGYYSDQEYSKKLADWLADYIDCYFYRKKWTQGDIDKAKAWADRVSKNLGI